MKNFITTILLLVTTSVYSQFLIKTGKLQELAPPHPSAVLEILDDNKGILIPKINLSTNPISNPKQGLLIYNESNNRLSFANDGNWVKNFADSDAGNLVKHTSTYVANSTNPVAISGSFTNLTPTIDSDTSGWTDLNVGLNITPKKSLNSILVNAEGMVQTNQTQTHTYTYAIAVFVDNKLKIVRKFSNTENGGCAWKKFELTGIFKDLSPNVAHNIKLYGKNIASSISSGQGNNTVALSYGGPNPSLSSSHTCRTNLNNFMARINLSIQVTE